jgi:hypothetical protein
MSALTSNRPPWSIWPATCGPFFACYLPVKQAPPRRPGAARNVPRPVARGLLAPLQAQKPQQLARDPRAACNSAGLGPANRVKSNCPRRFAAGNAPAAAGICPRSKARASWTLVFLKRGSDFCPLFNFQGRRTLAPGPRSMAPGPGTPPGSPGQSRLTTMHSDRRPGDSNAVVG